MENRKRQLTREQGLALASRYRSSGLTQAKFAESEGVTKSVLQYWIHKARKEALGSSDAIAPFRFVEVVSPQSTSVSHWTSGGATMEFTAGRMRFDTLPPAEYVARIAVEMAKGLSC